jgi:hypothetical protein
VVQCEALDIKLPSPQGFHGCVLALDGFISARAKPNVVDDAHYHSNRKKIHCFDVS